jgi:hypothetical protein
MRRRAILERMRDKTNQSHHFFLKFQGILSSIGPKSGKTRTNPLYRPEKKRLFAQKSPLLGLLFLAPLGACEAPAVEETVSKPMVDTHGCGNFGALQGALFGSLETSLSWSGSEMICESMLRPNDEGARLRFQGLVGEERLALIIAIPELQRGETATELPSNVTMTVEGSGRFFSTPNLDSCWTDINSHTPAADSEARFALSGILYCVAPLGEINGDAAVSIPVLTFSTIVDRNK